MGGGYCSSKYPPKHFFMHFCTLTSATPARYQNYGSYSLFKSSLTTHFSNYYLGTGGLYRALKSENIKTDFPVFSTLKGCNSETV